MTHAYAHVHAITRSTLIPRNNLSTRQASITQFLSNLILPFSTRAFAIHHHSHHHPSPSYPLNIHTYTQHHHHHHRRDFSTYAEPRFRPPAPYHIFTADHSVHDKRFLLDLKQQISSIKHEKTEALRNDPIYVAKRDAKRAEREKERIQNPGVTHYIYEYLKEHGHADKRTLWSYLLDVDKQHGYGYGVGVGGDDSLSHDDAGTIESTTVDNTSVDTTAIDHTSSYTSATATPPIHPHRVAPPTITAMTRLLHYLVKHKKLHVCPGASRREYYQYSIYDTQAVAAKNVAQQVKIATVKAAKRQARYEQYLKNNPKWLSAQEQAMKNMISRKKKPSTWVSYEERQRRKQEHQEGAEERGEERLHANSSQ